MKMPTDLSATLAEVERLPIEDRIRLVDAIWESVARADGLRLSDAQRRELERRVADADANPDDEYDREEVMNWLRSEPRSG
jgi:putative addiction module component (TIGR02574 family)